MKRTTRNTRPRLRNRLGILSGSVVLGTALIAGACSNTDSASPNVSPAQSPDTTVTVAETSPAADSTADELEAFLDQLDARDFGGVIAVRDGAAITTRAYGTADRENGVPIDTETVFDVGSITKQFTAAAILRLEMDGRLSVDDTLGAHVSGLPDDKAAITLHQLLTHTAGVPNNVGPDDEPIDRSAFLTRFSQTPLSSEPGSRFEYSNVGYALLGAVIELETGESYEAYLRAALFEPAGMLDTGYVLPDWDDHTVAVGYDNSTGDRFGRPDERRWDVNGPYWNLHGNGGILSTAADMLRWDQALNGNEVLDAAARAEFFAPHVADGPDEDGYYGYGWYVVPTPMGTPLIAHEGGNGTFYADFLRFVEQDVTVFMATNSDRIDDRIIPYQAANHVLDGQLAPMLGGGNDNGTGNDDDSGVAADPCGFDGLSIASLPDHPEIGELPDSAAGRAATLLLDLLAEGDRAARLDFATNHVAEQLGGDDPTAVADGIRDLQVQFIDYEAAQILQEDDRRFHVFMEGPDTELLISFGFDQTDPERLACLAVSP